jgi:proliferating cell nuclear antigen
MKAPGKPFSFAFAGCILRRLTIIFSSEVTISVTKDGVKFGVSGDTGAGTTTIKRSSSADAEDEDTTVELEGDDVTLTFALRYLGFFTKATPLAQAVSLQMSAEVPLVVEYKINSGDGKNEDKKKDRRGYIRYYLAPKIEEE